MADAVVNQNSEMVSNDSGVLRQAGSLVSQVSRIYNQPAFQRSLPTFVALAVATIGLGTYLWMQLHNEPHFMLDFPKRKNRAFSMRFAIRG